MRTIERENELTIYLEEDEELELTWRRIPDPCNKQDLGRFNAIGVLNNKKEKGSKVDLLDILFSCSRAAGLLFIDLKNNRDPQNNMVTMKQWETLTVGQLRSKYSQLKELMDKHLIIKVEPIDDHISKPPRFTYMINPYIIIPRKSNDTKNLWKLLGGSVN